MRAIFILPLLVVAASCSPMAAGPAPGNSGQPAPGTSTPAAPGEAWPYGAIVSAANPYAVEAAARVLRAGGHAVDAAIAAHAVLGLVEPQSSGIGGGAFLLAYEHGGRLLAYDGRETAPAAVSGDLFIAAGESLGFMQAWQSGRSVGTPGTVALYAAVNEELGRLNLAEVLAPAIELARDGFEVSPRLATFLVRARDVIRLDENPDTAAYFYPDGEALTPGTIRANPAYAETLSRIAEHGPDAFYRGALAREIVDAVQAEPLPGELTLEDLANYRIERRDALCGAVQALRVCTMPPPSSGIAELMILGLYDRLMAGADDDSEATRWAAFVDAQRLAYADRDRYIGDPAFVAVPSRDLLDAGYLDARARQRGAPDAAPVPGDPGAVLRGKALLGEWSADTTAPLPSTTHLSVVDAAGNAVSMTASVEAPFGSSRWAGGFLLNNQLTDFARDPGDPDAAPANGVEPGKRPRSSMSPTIVFDADGGLRMVTGSPGGNAIVAYVAKTLVGSLRWGLSAQAATDLPNVVARGQTVRVETGIPGGAELAATLSGLGYPVEESEGENSGLHVILVQNGELQGAADPRREGEVQRVAPH